MKRRLLHLLLLLLGLSLLWGAGQQNPALLEARQQHGLDHAEPLENAPPLLVFTTVALGGFSGMLSDMLWVRAAQLQMEGNYLELVQLADWITRLQPRFAQGWIYHSWNLAYNISVMFPRPEDRWRWVRHGIELLRDGGLRYNPAHPTLYREMAWLYQHKLGMATDSAHVYYKRAWAEEMEWLFDGRGPRYDELTQTPFDRAEVLRIPGVPDVVDQLRSRGIDPFAYEWPDPDRMREMREVLPSNPVAGEALLQHIRLRLLTERYRLVPSRMQEIEQQIGPLDWRLPQAHAVYWAWSGRPYATGWEAMMLDRMIFQSMAEAFRQGNYFFSHEENRFIPSPAPDLLPSVERAFQLSLNEHDDDTMRTAHLNFLNHALTVLFTHDRTAEARKLFDRLQAQYPEAIADRDFERYLLDQFDAEPADDAIPDIEFRLAQALYYSFFWQALGDEARAAGYQQLTELIWLMDAPQDQIDLWDLENAARQAVLDTLTSEITRERIR